MGPNIKTSETLSTKEQVQRSSGYGLFNIFRRDFELYEGVPRINIYLLRLLFTLMFLFLSYDSWSYILNHTGPWNNVGAAAWCMWGSYSVISFIGILRPLKMLPIVLFEIVYKIAWLFVVAYPLWLNNELIGSSAEGIRYSDESTPVFRDKVPHLFRSKVRQPDRLLISLSKRDNIQT